MVGARSPGPAAPPGPAPLRGPARRGSGGPAPGPVGGHQPDGADDSRDRGPRGRAGAGTARPP
ncbi:hypothetical protein FXF52_04445 [Micromonospora sp. MP36]|nr:hypothetical protein FXF52_04445 [Micromonospora sp. MP36]